MESLLEKLSGLRQGRITLRKLTRKDGSSLKELIGDGEVYRYLPTFLYEKKYPVVSAVVDGMYGECLDESVILGVFEEDGFCGLAEWYGCRFVAGKVSVGYRFLRKCWGRGLAAETLALMLAGLEKRTEIRLVTASTMTENRASAQVLRKNGFVPTAAEVAEDWGYDHPTVTDKWMRILGNEAEYWKRLELSLKARGDNDKEK